MMISRWWAHFRQWWLFAMIDGQGRHIGVSFAEDVALVKHLPGHIFRVNLRCLWIHKLFEGLLQVYLLSSGLIVLGRSCGIDGPHIVLLDHDKGRFLLLISVDCRLRPVLERIAAILHWLCYITLTDSIWKGNMHRAFLCEDVWGITVLYTAIVYSWGHVYMDLRGRKTAMKYTLRIQIDLLSVQEFVATVLKVLILVKPNVLVVFFEHLAVI